MVDDAALEANARRELPAFVQVLVDRVAASEQGAADGDLVGHTPAQFTLRPQALTVLPSWSLLRDDPRVRQIIRSKLPR